MSSNNTRITFLFILLVFMNIVAMAQEGIPVIKRYSVENYHAGIENWDVIQDDKGLMYFANSEGLLEFDGVHWRLIQTEKKSALRSFAKAKNGTIYAGGDSEFGYLSSDHNGQKEFTSLTDSCPPAYRHYLSHVWRTVIHRDKILFLAGGTVFIFNDDHTLEKILEEDIYLRSLFRINNRIYAYSNKKGILILNEHTLEFTPFFEDEFILNRSLEFISGHPEGGIRFHLFDKGFYRYFSGTLTKEPKDYAKPLNTDYIFCQGRTDSLLLLGTTTNGLYALNSQDLDMKYHFDKSLGLNDNKVFAVASDHDNNIWVCHENGLSFLEINTPVRLVNEKLGINGTGYCSIRYDSTLLVGTSHGLFASNPDDENNFHNFSIFKKIRQPVYFLEKRGKHLLIGCLLELFQYDGKELKVINKTRHNNKILPYPNRPDDYIVSCKTGFLLLKYDNGFRLEQKIQGTDRQIHDFETDNTGKLWVIDNEHRLFTARPDESLHSFISFKRFDGEVHKNLKFLSLSHFNNKMYMGTESGLYYYDQHSDAIKKVSQEGKKDYAVNWIYNQNNEGLWYEKAYYDKGELYYNIDTRSENELSFDAGSLNSIIYGNKAFSFGKMDKSRLTIGTSDGFILYNLNFKPRQLSVAETYIRRIAVTDAKDTTRLEGLWTGSDNVWQLPLDQEETFVEIDCASNYFYSQDKVAYSYRMDGIDKHWSEWDGNEKIHYAINGHGEFTFRVKASGNYSTQSKETTYHFAIKKPWYKTLWWYFTQIGILLILMAVSVYYNRNGSTKISKASAFVLVLIILTVFESTSELVQDWIDAQGVTIFALKIAINIGIALSIKPVESWLRNTLIRPAPVTHKAAQHIKESVKL